MLVFLAELLAGAASRSCPIYQQRDQSNRTADKTLNPAQDGNPSTPAFKAFFFFPANSAAKVGNCGGRQIPPMLHRILLPVRAIAFPLRDGEHVPLGLRDQMARRQLSDNLGTGVLRSEATRLLGTQWARNAT